VSRLLFTAGEALAVFLAEDRPEDAASRLAEATRFDRIVSGAEVNTAVGFVRAGHRARLVTRLGCDALGDAVDTQLADWGVDARITRDAERATGVLVRTVGGADRGEAVQLRRGAAIEGLTPDDIDAHWTPDADAVFVTGVTLVRSASAAAAVRRSVTLARASGALVVVDPNLRPSLAPASVFARELALLRGRLDVAIGDPAELALLSDTSAADAPATLLAAGARLVVTKLGADGVTATDGVRTVSAPAQAAPHELVDTVGAGDAFAAELIAAVLDGEALSDVLDRASTAAADVVRVRGDIPPLIRKAAL
jgi:2-dehydro-3-deoxygluconokinase